MRGWEGLISNEVMPLTARSVSGIINLGGTILHTTRCPHIKTAKGQAKAAAHLAKNHVDGLAVIGGDGSFRAAMALSEKTDTPMVGIPATIDNDVYGTDETIGFDTTVNTDIATIDKIRDTATALDRIFIVEVMGRTRGFIAAMVGLTSGAEIILVPEVPVDREAIYRAINSHAAEGKKTGIIVAAEGIGDTGQLARDVQANTGLETRLSIIGYAQRGGSPTARSRYLANLFGEKAVQRGNQFAPGQVAVGAEDDDGAVGRAPAEAQRVLERVLHVPTISDAAPRARLRAYGTAAFSGEPGRLPGASNKR
jgi:6-phosphofructokinase 1